jgi:hypothetical protein
VKAKGLIIRYRIAMSLFIIGLVLSGLTAFPLLRELELLCRLLGIAPNADYHTLSGLHHWLGYVREGLRETYQAYPFVAYGTDWLAFAHLVIAVYFIGPLLQPTQHDWILISGMISCVLVLPLALVCGPLRGIPFYWRMIDCSFGVMGIVPLAYCYYLSRKLKGA